MSRMLTHVPLHHSQSRIAFSRRQHKMAYRQVSTTEERVAAVNIAENVNAENKAKPALAMVLFVTRQFVRHYIVA